MRKNKTVLTKVFDIFCIGLAACILVVMVLAGIMVVIVFIIGMIFNGESFFRLGLGVALALAVLYGVFRRAASALERMNDGV